MTKAEKFMNMAGSNDQFTIGFGLQMKGAYVKDKETKKVLLNIRNFSDDYYQIDFILNGVNYVFYRCEEKIEIRVNVNGDWMDISNEKFNRDFDKFLESYK